MSMQGDKGVRGDRVRYKYKCEKLPSWDTAKGGTRAAFCSGMYCKGVKRHAKYACRRGGEADEKKVNALLGRAGG